MVSYSEPVRTTLPLRSCASACTRFPISRTWCPTGPPTTTRTWGFCLSHDELLELPDGDYEVVIDSTLEPGHLSYAELTIEGERRARRC